MDPRPLASGDPRMPETASTVHVQRRLSTTSPVCNARCTNIWILWVQGKASSKRAKAAAQAPAPGFDGWLNISGSDPTLTMMHALGKFLYNKRLPPEPEAPAANQATEHNMLRGGVFSNLDAMQLRQPSASQPFSGREHPLLDEPDSGNQRQHPAAGSQPSQLSCESSKVGGHAVGQGIPLSSWPGDDGDFTAAEDLIDLTVEDAFSQQQQQQQPSGPGTSHPDAVDVSKLPMAARCVQMPKPLHSRCLGDVSPEIHRHQQEALCMAFLRNAEQASVHWQPDQALPGRVSSGSFLDGTNAAHGIQLQSSLFQHGNDPIWLSL